MYWYAIAEATWREDGRDFKVTASHKTVDVSFYDNDGKEYQATYRNIEQCFNYLRSYSPFNKTVISDYGIKVLRTQLVAGIKDFKEMRLARHKRAIKDKYERELEHLDNMVEWVEGEGDE